MLLAVQPIHARRCKSCHGKPGQNAGWQVSMPHAAFKLFALNSFWQYPSVQPVQRVDLFPRLLIFTV